MAGRYSRFYSNYIFRKKHQNTKDGTIWERDWVTIGAQHQIEKGKRPFFGDSGFLYTINNIPSTKKRHNYGKWVASWLYPDVEDAKQVINSVEVNYLSNDIRDFVYYGSCSELISTSIINIINWYPSFITTGTNPSFFFLPKADGTSVRSAGYKIDNPFNMDLIHKDVSGKYINIHRYLAASYDDFDMVVDVHGDTEKSFSFDQITNYTVIQNDWKHKVLGVGITDKIYQSLPSNKKMEYERIDHSCPEENININTLDIEIKAVNTEIRNQKTTVTLKGYRNMDNYVFSFYSGEVNAPGFAAAFSIQSQIIPTINAMKPWTLSIFLKEEFVNEFFDKLDDFEKLLLRTDTNPLFKNVFLTPHETLGGMVYYYDEYTWPISTFFNGLPIIDISSPSYIDFITKLSNLGNALDELWCDNLWRNMTHESIKNYDWTYRRSYVEGEEEENILGGKRMESLIRIYGRLFDDMKRYIDGIKLSNRVTYDGFNNLPDAEMSDKLDYIGWDVFSTIPILYDNESIEDAIPDSFIIVKKTNNNEQITIDEYNSLSDEEKEMYEFKPSDLSLISLSNIEEMGYKWFYSINPENITSLFMDNHFMRQLMLSTKYIMKTKGTRDCIEMVLGLFGVGNNDKETFFEINEFYHYAKPFIYEEKTAETINKLNHRDNANYDYDLYYEGIPLKNAEIYNAKYIVPFYDSKKHYRGDFIFQSDGGWCANTDDINSNELKFKETLSYLKVAGNISDLLSINPYDVSSGDIYYVIDLHDIVKYDESIDEDTISDVTHFFICNDEIFTEKYSSWTNIKVDDALYDKAMYLYNIISTDIGNNPHVGYGRYDLGNLYLEYMRFPFKYDVDTYVLDEDIVDDMWEYQITVNNRMTKEPNEKILNCISNSEQRDKFFADILKEKQEKIDYLIKISGDTSEEARIIRHQYNNRIADINVILKTVSYYLNDKVFILTNKVKVNGETPKTYKKYFFNVILQYLMQVIPSTTILVLKDFD